MSRMEASATSDETLIKRYAAGDVTSFQELYDRYESQLWKFVLRQSGNRAMAEELTQDVWFTVTREAPRFNDTGRFGPWLFTIARNRIIDNFRTTQRHENLDATDEPAAPAIDSPPAQTERLQTGQAILRALSSLPTDQREAFVLQADAGLSVSEIATVTGTNLETAKSRLRYARDKLRESLKAYL
jgi:RNA polymerase sigma factor (sigma-70 family)